MNNNPNGAGGSAAQGGQPVAHNMVTTGFELDNYRIVKNLGVARGIIVRSRNIFGTIGAGLQTLVGGNITLYTNLCEKTREHAFDLMLEHAGEMGANAVIARRHGGPGIRHGGGGGGEIERAIHCPHYEDLRRAAWTN
jgi:uncharacterized protein YbjQ (UPF0145 family)